jgi:hypothetical protein
MEVELCHEFGVFILDKQVQCFENVKIDTKTVKFHLRIAKVSS